MAANGELDGLLIGHGKCSPLEPLCCAPRLVSKPRWRIMLLRLIFSISSANQRGHAVSWKCSISIPSCSTWAVSQPCTSCTCTACSRSGRFVLMEHGMWPSCWGVLGPCWIHAVLCCARSVQCHVSACWLHHFVGLVVC